MSYSYSSPRSNQNTPSSRPPSSDNADNGTIINHNGENTPRGGITASNAAPAKGTFLYVKAGFTINFYTDSAGANKVGPSGGNGGQNSAPTRIGGEYIGTATGSPVSPYGLIAVSWVNKWWQNGTLFKRGGYVTDNAVSFVKVSEIETRTVFVSAADQTEAEAAAAAAAELAAALAAAAGGGGGGGGVDSTTLGLAAVGAALLLSKKKK